MINSRPRAMVFSALSLAALVAISGCAGDPAPVESSAPPVAEPSVTPTPEPTRPALADLVVTPDGLDYLVVGAPVPEHDEATAIVEYDPTYCKNDEEPGTAGAGAWSSVYGSDDASGFTVVTDQLEPDGPISDIMLFQDDIATAEGIRQGSTEEELLAAYTEFDEVIDFYSTKIYIINGDKGRLLFEVAVEGDDGGSYWDSEPEKLGTVLWLRVVTLDEKYLSIAGTDSGGPCPV